MQTGPTTTRPASRYLRSRDRRRCSSLAGAGRTWALLASPALALSPGRWSCMARWVPGWREARDAQGRAPLPNEAVPRPASREARECKSAAAGVFHAIAPARPLPVHWQTVNTAALELGAHRLGLLCACERAEPHAIERPHV